MRIVVLVKHVPCATTGLSFHDDHTLTRGGVRSQLNDADACAVEQAWRIAVCRSGSEVVAVTMGPHRAVDALRNALVLGADEGVHLLDHALAGSDAAATAKVLAAAIARLGFDLVLCGDATADSGMSVIPAMVAERLGVPALCCADTVRVRDGHAEIRREDATCAEVLAADLPAVISVTRRSCTPRYPRFSSVVRARHKLIRTWPLARVGTTASSRTVVRSLTPIPARRQRAEGEHAAAELVEFLTARDFL